ncbi:MAG: hypothetical protein ACK4N6_02950 [Rhodocyclaceae bacterium]
MKPIRAWLAAAACLTTTVWAGQDFQCMQGCLGQGYDREYCLGVCAMAPGAGGMPDQPGLPKNPAFEEVMPKKSRQPPPKIADPKCMKDCQRRGYDYLFCMKRVCSYSLY